MKKFLFVCLFLIGLGWALSNFSGLANKGVYDSIVLDFREDIGITKIFDQIRTISDEYQVAPRLNSEFSISDNVYIVKGNRQLLKNLKSSLSKYTEYVEPNYIYNTDAIILDSGDGVPNDPMYGKQWNLRSINVESAWNETQGDGITVAVIDTGVSKVPDLEKTKFVPGYDFVNDRTLATDDNGHGTHVAGTIAQATNNNYGVAGIAYEA
ncbi:MAG: S8 family serine peptidase, partial [Trichodesmium sp. St18_bin3_1_1]|nr:S8 family serine peptidase [Trichodesmium sp. St18_bin3_1_1]